MRQPPVLVVLVVAVALGLAGCGDDGDDEETGTSSTTTTDGRGATTTTDGPSTTGSDGSSTSVAGSTSTPEDDLPGEPIDIGPREGARLGVIGVAAGDTLNVRSGPGTDFDVIRELGPLSQEPTATGHNRTLDDGSLWVEVDVEDTTGWVNGAFVAQPGAVVDITGEVADVSGATVVELAEAVAARRASSDEGSPPTVTVVAGPDARDDGEEVTVDVLGLADDAQKGERLIVVGAPAGGDAGYTVASVQAIALCARGVTDDLLCT